MKKKENNTIVKNVSWAVISFLIAILTIYTIIKENKVFSLEKMKELIMEGSPIFLLFAVICMLLFIFAEGEALHCIIQRSCRKTSHSQAFLYSAADIYFSAITPSASGGQPASMYFMLKDGLSVSETTICLIYNLLMYNAAIVVIAILCFIFRPDVFVRYALPCKTLIIIGCILLLSLMIGFYLLIRRSGWLEHLGAWLLRFLNRLHLIKHPEHWEKKMENTIAQYAMISGSIMNDKILLLQAFLWNLFQRSVQITIPVFIYLGLGGVPAHISDIWFTQAYSTIGSNCIPVPGAMGVIDYLLIEGFQNIMSDTMAVHTELLSRGISFYICIVISLFTVFIGFMKRKRK